MILQQILRWAQVGLCIGAANATFAQSTAFDLTIKVSAFRNSQGALACALFSESKGFPNKTQLASHRQMATIVGSSSRCLFSGLKAGSYAVAVVHDENNNETLDTNLFGAPTEGYGVSNNKTYAMSAPNWEESRFELSAKSQKQLNVILRY